MARVFGILIYHYSLLGGYPDGRGFLVFFAMNFAAPLIDYYTQPELTGIKSQTGLEIGEDN